MEVLRRPNVLFVTVDQWRGDCLSAVGHPVVSTPNLDRLASEGVLFRRHHAQAAPCGPSRSSLLTGLYLANHRSVTNGTPLDDRFTNIAREARRLGYDPVLFGYTDISIDPRAVAPDDPRLTLYEGILPGFRAELDLIESLVPWGEWLRSHGYEVPDDVRALFDRRLDVPGAADRGSTWAPAVYAAEHSEAAFVTGEVLRWIGEQGDEPWFVHAAYIRPHPPWIVPAPWHDLYDPAEVPAAVRHPDPEAEGDAHPVLARFIRDWWHPWVSDERELRQARATYYGMLGEVDDQLGHLFDALRVTDAWDDTIVVLTCDHGEQLGDHWLAGKVGWFDQSYHIPCIVRDPSAAADSTRGTQVDAFTENVDLFPTILDLLGAPVPLQCDGMPLTKFLHGEAFEGWRTSTHWEFDFRNVFRLGAWPWDRRQEARHLVAHRTDTGLYVHLPGKPAVFYDLTDDPAMLHNRADDPTCREAVLEHAQGLLDWRLTIEERTLSGMLLTEAGPLGRFPDGWPP